MFVALVAAVIALSATDRKTKKVRMTIEQSIDTEEGSIYPKNELPDEFQEKYQDFPDPISSHRVHFKITNTSGFTFLIKFNGSGSSKTVI